MRTDMRMAARKALIGRTITGVNLRSFPDGKGGTAHDPTITLDNGRKIFFIVEETDVGEYGVCVGITDTQGKPKNKPKGEAR